MEIAEEVKDAKHTAKDAVRKSSKLCVIVYNRLKRLKDLDFLVGELKEELADEYHPQEILQIISTIRLQINRERTIGCQGGSLWWLVHIAMLICELLVNVTPPFVIPANIQTMSAALNGSEVNEIPSLDYVCKCRVVVKNLNDMLATCRPGKTDNWHHIFTDGTTRSQITSQNLVIGLMADGNFESVIASSSVHFKFGK